MMSLNTKMKIVCVAVAFALPVAAIAAPKAQTPLVQPTGFQCSWSDGNAASSWDDSNTNAPNPADSKYGGDLETIKHALRKGRNGKMPAFGEQLNEDKIRLLTAYVYSLSNQ